MNEANTMADILGRNESVDEASKRLGLTAPRVTPADIDNNIKHEYFITGAEAVTAGDCREPGMPGYGVVTPIPEALRLMTVCILITRNGFVVVGHSAPASPENYRAELGRRYAKENAVRQLWPLMGYALREQLHIDAAVASASTIPAPENGDTVAGFIGWLSADIPELRNVELPRLSASYYRWRGYLDGYPTAPAIDLENGDDRTDVDHARATGDGMPENTRVDE